MASVLLAHLKRVCSERPLVRGMLSYSVIWPTSVLIQQTAISGRRWDEIDWAKCARFSAYGALYVAPTLFAWVRISSVLWPQTTLRTGIYKALVEQITYTPFAIASLFFVMSLAEGRRPSEACTEVAQKFAPTYRVAMCVWPAVATVNFTLVPERNRVPFISVCSLLWTCFLAYVKQMDTRSEKSGQLAH